MKPADNQPVGRPVPGDLVWGMNVTGWVLHLVPNVDPQDFTRGEWDGVSLCRLHARYGQPLGIWRTVAPRCRACCRRTGIPWGVGIPRPPATPPAAVPPPVPVPIPVTDLASVEAPTAARGGEPLIQWRETTALPARAWGGAACGTQFTILAWSDGDVTLLVEGRHPNEAPVNPLVDATFGTIDEAKTFAETWLRQTPRGRAGR